MLDPAVFERERARSRAIVRYGSIATALAFAAILATFVFGARRSGTFDQRTREQGSVARELAHPPRFRSYKDQYQSEHPDMLVRSPAAALNERTIVMNGAPAETFAPERNPSQDRRHPKRRLIFGFRDPGTAVHYGFELPERPKKRSYETEDAPHGPPMLMVFTEPAGVAVDVDGVLVGASPILRAIPGDKAHVEVRLWGGAYKEQRFTLKKGSDGNFQLGVTMEAKPVDRPVNPKPLPPGFVSSGPAPKTADGQEDAK